METEEKMTSKPDGTLVDTLHIEGLPDENYIPEGFDSVSDFLMDMREEFKADLEFDRENREQALDDKRFAAGEQWDQQVLRDREGLPCLVINNIPQFTAQLVGDWRESRKAIKVVPSNDEDVDIASVRGDLIRSIDMESRAGRVYDQAFESVVQCGDGAFRVSIEYARDDVFDQSLFLRPIEDALSVVWDRFSVDPTGRDAKRVFVNDKIPKKEYKQKFGDIPADSLYGEGFTLEDLSSEGWVEQDSYQVSEYWRLVERRRIMGLFEGGHIFILDDDNSEELIEQYGYPIKTRVTWVTYAQMHLCTGFAILSGPYEYMLTRVPILRMSGRVTNVGGRRVRYGLVRFMKDAARLKNFWRSVAAEQLGYAPKAKWMVTEAAVEGREENLRNAHNSRDPILVFNDDAQFGVNVQRVDPPGIEAALLNESQINAQDMKDVTGIHDASLGIRSNETSGRAIMARQREGDVANLTFHDNANAAVLEAGDVINQLIPQVYDGTRIIRTIGEDETAKFMAINDPMNPDAIDIARGRYDVALSTGSSYTTRRVEAAQAMMDAIQVYPEIMQVAGDLVVKAQDWPGAEKLAERLKKTIPPHLLGEDEEGGLGITAEQLAQMQAALQEGKAELERMEQELKDKSAEIRIDAYNAQTQRIRALSDHMVDDQEQFRKAVGDILQYSAKLDESERQDLLAELQVENTRAQISMPEGPSTAPSGPTSQPSSANG
jgi:hypothetical protein